MGQYVYNRHSKVLIHHTYACAHLIYGIGLISYDYLDRYVMGIFPAIWVRFILQVAMIQMVIDYIQ